MKFNLSPWLLFCCLLLISSAGQAMPLTCTPPAITAAPGPQTVTVPSGGCSAVATYTASASGSPTYTHTFSGATNVTNAAGTGSGSSFNIGVTTVTVTASNGCAPDATTSFSVTVQAPEISVTDLSNVTIPDGSTTPSTANGTDFGSVNTGSQGNSYFYIRNNGNANLNVSSISFTGQNAGDFSLDISPNSTISSFNSSLFSIRFIPSGGGLRSATVHV